MLAQAASQVVKPLLRVKQGPNHGAHCPATQHFRPQPLPWFAQTWPQEPQFRQSLLVSLQVAPAPALLVVPPVVMVPPLLVVPPVLVAPPVATPPLALPPELVVVVDAPPLALPPELVVVEDAPPLAAVPPELVLPPLAVEFATQMLLRHSSPESQVPLP